MKTWRFLLLFLLLFLSNQCKNDLSSDTKKSPDDEEQKEDDICKCEDELYYYSYTNLIQNENMQYPWEYQKLYLCDHLSNNWLLIGFNFETANTEIMNFINKTEFFEPAEANNIGRWNYDFGISYTEWKEKSKIAYIWVKTREHKTYRQLTEIIRFLELSPIVRSADYVFCNEPIHYLTTCYETNCSNIWGFVLTFYVKVKDKEDLSDLYAVVEETNTWILGQHADIAPNFFIIVADKNSKGNARQMANYFYETGKFTLTELLWMLKGPSCHPSNMA